MSSGSQVVPCRQKDRWTDMTKLTVVFCNFQKGLKMFFLKNNPGKSLNLKIRHTASKKLTFQKSNLLCFSQMMHHKYMKLPLWQRIYLVHRQTIISRFGSSGIWKSQSVRLLTFLGITVLHLGGQTVQKSWRWSYYYLLNITNYTFNESHPRRTESTTPL